MRATSIEYGFLLVLVFFGVGVYPEEPEKEQEVPEE